jgi:MFS transporter, MHS family, proline/betaine transporter
MSEPTPAESTKRSRRVVLAVSVGTLIEGYDSLLYGYFASIFAQQFFPRSDPTAALLNTFLIFAVGFAIRPLGGIVFGHVGDRLGRRTALVASIMVMAGASLSIGLLPTYQSVGALAPALLLVCRLLQGFSVGGEYVGANVLILEHVSAKRSGRSVSANQVAGYIGISCAGATSLLLAQTLSRADLTEWGWRLPYLAALPLGIIGLYLRMRIPDSPDFEAGRVKRQSFPLATAFRVAPRGMLIYGAWFAMVGLGGYLLHGYLASYLIRVVGLSPAQAFGANLVAVLTLAAGALTGGYLVDKRPPALVAIVSAVAIAVVAVPGFLLIQRGTVAAAILGQIPLAACLGIAATFGATMTVTQFPAEVRYTAAGLSHNVTVTLFGSTAPYVSTWLIARTGSPIAPAWYVSGMALLGLTVGLVLLARARGGVRIAGPVVAPPTPR